MEEHMLEYVRPEPEAGQSPTSVVLLPKSSYLKELNSYR